MTLAEIIAAIQAAEQIIPALVSFVNTIHPPTTDVPTRATAVLTATSNALQMAGVAAETVSAMQGTLSAAASAAIAAPAQTVRVATLTPVDSLQLSQMPKGPN